MTLALVPPARTMPPPARLVEPADVIGTLGPQITQAAALVGIDLDEHQQLIVNTGASLRDMGDGEAGWAARQFGVSEARQNGKTITMLAREVGGIIALEEPTIIHSAHEVKTAMQSYRMLLNLCENWDILSRMVKKVISVNGREGIIFKQPGGRETEVSYMARTKGSGRGFSAKTILLDEDQEMSFEIFAAILPTLSAVRNSQVWMFGTPPGPLNNGEVVTRLRRQAATGRHPRIGWIEWGASPKRGEELSWDYSDQEHWYAANPACPSRIDINNIEDEFAAMDEDTFRRERLGEWESDEGLTVIPMDAWDDQTAPDAVIESKHTIAIDVSPARNVASVVLAGVKADGKRHVELLAQGPGTDWVGKFVRDIVHGEKPIKAVVVDGSSAAQSLVEPLKSLHQVRCTILQTRNMASACGQAYDAFVSGEATHSGQSEITAAMIGSEKRDLVDAWGLSRKRAEVDITAFVGAVEALYGVQYAKTIRPKAGTGRRRRDA